MATAEQDLRNFTKYAQDRIAQGDDDLSIDELFDLWRKENPSKDAYTEDIAAIAASIEDFRNGDRGAAAGQLSRELRRATGLPNE